ncbi:MAG: hypothetical protein NT038_03550 [Euryarchaeota archaeon]|nr:hypothetical protein [Euryarchaeota archaeon]
MRNGNETFGTTFTFGVVVRGELAEINKLIDFLKQNNLVVAYQEIGQHKMWIKTGGDSDDRKY